MLCDDKNSFNAAILNNDTVITISDFNNAQ